MSQFNYQEILDTYRQLQNQANQANQQRYNNILDLLGGTREDIQGQFSEAAGMIQDQGQAELRDIEQSTQREQAANTQDLISRGLFNTTILNQQQRAAEEDAAEQRARVRQNIGESQAQVEQREAGALQDLDQFQAQIMEARTDQGPNLDRLSQMIQQGSAAQAREDRLDDPLGLGLSTNARAGRDVFGDPLGQNPAGGGGGGAGGGGTFGDGPGMAGGGGGAGGGQTGTYIVGGGGGARQPGGAQTGGTYTVGSSGARFGSYGGGAGGGGAGGGGSTAATIRRSADQTASDFDQLFHGQDVYAGGEVVGKYAGDQQMTDYGAELVRGGKLDTRFLPEEMGGVSPDQKAEIARNEPSTPSKSGRKGKKKNPNAVQTSREKEDEDGAGFGGIFGIGSLTQQDINQ